jgi:TonB family protein
MSRRGCFPLVLLIALASSCQPRGESGPPERDESVREEAREEPILETESIEGEEVQTLPTERIGKPAGRPCAWSSLWSRPDEPNPLLAGVGGVAMPTKIGDAPIQLPVDPSRSGQQIVVEIVIDSSGRVPEATILRSAQPRWAEAEDIILAAVRQWRYEPPRFEGTPISVCSTVFVGL